MSLYGPLQKTSSDTPIKPHNQLIKQAFEQAVGEDFLWYAYEPQYVFARRLFKIAIMGRHNSYDTAKVEEFLKEWKAFYNALMEDTGDHSREDVTSNGDNLARLEMRNVDMSNKPSLENLL